MWAHFQAHWRLKLFLTVLLNLAFWLGYSWLGRHAFFPVRVPPLTWLDTAIPFQPEPWAWVYLSQFSFTSTLPWFLATRAELWRYVTGLIVLCAASFTLFFFFPVASPRPAGATTIAMAWISGYDAAFNAFPSLHAGFLAYLGTLGWRMSGRAWPAGVWVVVVLWGGAILYATIATRQHYAVDLIAGGALGYGADRLAWRTRSGASAVRTMARSSGLASQDGCR